MRALNMYVISLFEYIIKKCSRILLHKVFDKKYDALFFIVS